MRGTEEIRDGRGEILALIVRSGYRPDGVSFLSPSEWPLQLGVSTYLPSQVVRAHSHRPRRISIDSVQEVVHVDAGRIQVDFYDTGDHPAGTSDLSTGDTILFIRGGHGIRMLEETRIIEVKQGPYSGEADDKRYL
jgi:hypothetical protein